MILIKSFISSFEIDKVNPFPALTAPFPLIFPLNLFIAFEAKLPSYPGKLSVVKKLQDLVLFSLNYLTKNQKINLI